MTRFATLRTGRLPRTHRRAGIIVEFLLAFPILLIAVLVLVEFGVIMANLKQIAAISRDGAKLAASTAPLNAATATLIRARVDRDLESAGYGASASAGVTLRHTVGGTAVFTDGTCSDPVTPAMPSDAVRVTVCVELTEFTPNLLSTFGFDITGRVAEHTTTFEYQP